MADNQKKLFTEFPPVSTAQWEEVIRKDLKGADYDKKLVWKTMEGFNVKPYYRAEDLEGLPFLDSKPGEFPFVRGTKCNNRWMVRQSIVVYDPREANALALEVLMRGVDSLGFEINGSNFSAEDLDLLLKGIDLRAVELHFDGAALLSDLEKHVFALIERCGYGPKEVRVSFGYDPCIWKLSMRGDQACLDAGSYCRTNIKAAIERAQPYKKIRCITVNGHVFNSCGATIVQELAFALANGHDYLSVFQDDGLTIDQIARAIAFKFSVGSNYFMEIAKFRAARLLWANIVSGYAPECECSAKMKITGVTSDFNMTVYDPYVNMLRGTTEAMSAALGGVDTLEVLPFDWAFEEPTEFSARIARNVQLLLKEESHFDQVVDPAGGSYYIENLTASIAEQAWKLFHQVEELGGYAAAFKAGFIKEQLDASADKRRKNIATRREILLGTNQYPNFIEKADNAIDPSMVGVEPAGVSSNPNLLKPFRGGMEFEQVRLAVDRSGKTPIAFMLTVGNLAMARARSQFAGNFFGCAGIEPADNLLFASVEQGVEAALAAKADIVVLCSSDDEYVTLAPEAFKALDGKAIFVVAGAPASQPELEAQGIRNFISVRSNVLETLKGYVRELGINLYE
ncbi:MAG: methylmalonyl-CoA mutase family protein [Rikenellaceae bacterium]|jgi:methylmalonyl-CoA mutase|nr:methylmalonyl-CoA mutase family protein [Rikenellaceae bacterium]